MTCLAVGIVARAKDCAVLYDFGGGCAYGDADGDLIVRIQPQAQFEQYRVDALVSMLYVQGQEENFQSFSARVVLECDGFEFHERTREQAEHDRARDRFLQTLGLNVFHFLGAEIWRDAFKCAEDVMGLLDNCVRQQCSAPWRKSPRSVGIGSSQARRAR
jgi:very-short-patch-repair endonuclease